MTATTDALTRIVHDVAGVVSDMCWPGLTEEQIRHRLVHAVAATKTSYKLCTRCDDLVHRGSMCARCGLQEQYAS